MTIPICDQLAYEQRTAQNRQVRFEIRKKFELYWNHKNQN